MKLKISKEIFDRYPGLVIGIVVAKSIDNTGEVQEVHEMIDEKSKEIRENYSSETLTDEPRIGSWREVYRAFGAKPKKYNSSIESLYRTILKGGDLSHINKIVDIYNYISIKHILPVGGDDLDKVEGDIVLKFAKGDEKFVRLNSDEVKRPKKGEVIYTDDKEVLCRRWNWRECDKTKMTEQTKNVVLVLEGVPPVTKEDVQEASEELSELVQKYCRGKTKVFILDKNNKEGEI